jgi:hypothetical protein
MQPFQFWENYLQLWNFPCTFKPRLLNVPNFSKFRSCEHWPKFACCQKYSENLNFLHLSIFQNIRFLLHSSLRATHAVLKILKYIWKFWQYSRDYISDFISSIALDSPANLYCYLILNQTAKKSRIYILNEYWLFIYSANSFEWFTGHPYYTLNLYGSLSYT